MAVPADPRRFALFISYERGYFAILADHLLRLLCDRVKLPAFTAETSLAPDQPPSEEAVLAADLLRQVPGLEKADGTFIAGLVFSCRRQARAAFPIGATSAALRKATSGCSKYRLQFMSVMAGLVPAIHVFNVAWPLRRGCPAQGRA